MILITSAQYLGAEFCAELGMLPPVFLPVGNKRLYEYQLARFESQGERIVVSLPEGFIADEYDLHRIHRLGAEVIYLPQGISLAESIVMALDYSLSDIDEAVQILHGDTLLEISEPVQGDIFSVATTQENYQWAGFSEEGETCRILTVGGDSAADDEFVLSGYFSFSSAFLLRDAMSGSGGDFVTGLNNYSAVNHLSPVEVKGWLDFGHIHTYYQSKSAMTTQRAFNDMNITSHVVTKTSEENRRIYAESFWYRNVPADIQLYLPKMLDCSDSEKEACYRLEYLFFPSLSEILVFGDLPLKSWKSVLRRCEEFLLAMQRYPGAVDERQAVNYLYKGKTLARLEEFSEESGVSLDEGWIFNGDSLPGLREIAGLIEVSAGRVRPSVMHGDFCLSNVLYDFRSRLVRVIDPRGYLAEGDYTIFGDARYDYAKLCHSVIGLYDFIVAGRYSLEISAGNEIDFSVHAGAVAESLDKYLRSVSFAGFDFFQDEIHKIMINLFLSMLPLHGDDSRRQMALLANALRLYRKYVLTEQA